MRSVLHKTRPNSFQRSLLDFADQTNSTVEKKGAEAPRDGYITVRFIRGVPRFLWLVDGEETGFGPYEAGEVVSLPEDLVKTLLKHRQVEVVE